MFCKLCDTDLSYKGNTTNEITHLSYRHKDEYAAVKKTSIPPQYLASMEVAHSSQLYESANSFKQAMPYPKSSARWKSLMFGIS